MSKHFKLLISKDNQLYLLALEDFVQRPGEALYVIKGKYRTGQAASAVRTSGQNWVPGELASDSTVALQVIPAPGEKVPALPAGTPGSLESHLRSLAEAGFVRVRLQGHEIERQDGTHKYTVKATAPIVLEVQVIDTTKEGKEAAVPKATPANISSFIDVVAVKKSPYLQVVTKLQYQTANNRLNFGHPEVHFNKPYRMTKGDLVNLAWP